ncbi:hypothetical protein [Kitasatospora fiedleri]|uniref:hypothetical protein n=1 Tax=Kitasatospora fiedleri TaxID=2991545 RepID=UPI00249CB808|nr:hypothetical protein [Kitasatospora fiedleri]
MKISRQSAGIAASVAAVLAIAGGSAWALNSSGDNNSGGQQQVQQADVADTSTPSPSATGTAIATAPATTEPETTTAPAATTPAAIPTSTKKAKSVSTPAPDGPGSTQAPADPNRVDPTNPNNQNNGGHGTVDNGPYPSSNMTNTVMPDPYPATSAP